jgi:hypothetical protein
MSFWRSLLLLAFACLSVSFGSAFREPNSPVTAPPPVYPLIADPLARQALEDAIAALHPTKIQWVQTAIWQQVRAAPLNFQAEGTYQSGPGHRLRFELQARYQDSSRRLLIINDGRTLWQTEQGTEPDAKLTRVNWLSLLQLLNSSDTSAQARAEFYRAHLFTGPRALLESMQESVIFTRLDRIRWQERDVLLLAGVRNAASDKSCGMFEPRQCRLVLDARTFWPDRVEWWGPAPGVAGDVRLSVLEFRQPVLHQPLPEEIFAFTPNHGRVTNCTEEWIEKIRVQSLKPH